MPNRRCMTGWLIAATILIVTVPLQAIVINDTGIAGYETGNAEFTGVVKIVGNGGSFICSGALISSSQVVTAGHCIAGATDWTVMFETGSGLFSVAATSSKLHPLFEARPAPLNQIHQYDIGILALAALAPLDAQVYGLLTDLSGVTTSTVMDLAGYGRGGNPTVGTIPSGTRHQAQNTVDGVLGSLNTVPLPDLPLYLTMVFGEGPDNEGLSHAGDSGGPLLLGNQIVGISSFGNLPRDTPLQAQTTYVSAYMSMANPLIGDWVADNTVPEPATYLLVGLVLIGISFLRRHHV